MLSDDITNIFAAFLSIVYLFFIFNLVTNCHDLLYINFKRFFVNLERLSDCKVVSFTKKEYGSAVYFFINFHEIFKVNV